MTNYNLSRDRFGRPLLYPPEGGKRVAYTRPSTMSKWLDDKGNLINWSASMAMIGLMRSKPLQARISAIIARSSDPYRENKGALKEIVETATQIAQASGRADFGTAIHEFTELLDAGTLDWSFVPEALKGPLEAYREATEVLLPLDTEVMVAVDETFDGKKIRAAGSLDRVVDHADLGPVVADIKTGTDEPKYSMGVTTQVAIYSRGQRYRDADFPGTPVFDDGEPNVDGTAWRKPLHPNINKSTGILIHCPLERVNSKYICNLYALDLEKGWENLLLGMRVQAARRTKELVKL